VKRLFAACGCVALAPLATHVEAHASTPPALEPLATSIVHVPSHLRDPQFPYWTRDGRRLLFAFTSSRKFAGAHIAVIRPNGRGFRCVTCGLGAIDIGKPFPFDDGRRVLVRTPSGSAEGKETAGFRYAVVECAPSVVACRQVRLVPIELPGGGYAGGVLQTRELRIAPDGIHVGLTQVRLDGWAMVVGKLHRESDRYTVTDARILNPRPELGAASSGWRRAGAWYELKRFTDDGRSVLFSSTIDGSQNLEDYALDLATGTRRRMTFHPDWDEDIAVGPDRRWVTMGTARTKHRMDVWSRLPRPPFLDFVAFAHVGRYMLSPGMRDCLLDPWVRPFGSRDRRYLGQQLNPGSFARGWTGRVLAQWRPDGTRIAFWEQTRLARTPPQRRRTRLVVVRLPARRPIRAPRGRPSPDPRWAPPYASRPPSNPSAVQIVHGMRSGTATVVFAGTALSGNFDVTYSGYSDDGRSFVDGTERLRNTFLASDATYSVDLRLSGARKGTMRGEVGFSGDGAAGSIETSVDGRTIDGPPRPAPCTVQSRPRLEIRVSPTRLVAGRRTELRVLVTSRPYGPRLPVRRVLVAVGGEYARSDRRGRARIRLRPRRPGAVRVTARAAGFRHGAERVPVRPAR
jgi:hypothetical protein